ncbi:MAG: deoxynucleoside kinase [Chitinophagales bacterium]|nr:deoxynucleoside kinase [Chitinophagales bacterium]
MNLPYNYIAIEGSIGAGKTTLASKLAQDTAAMLLLEKFEDNPFLPKFYADPQRHAFSVELYFTAERYRQLSQFLAASSASLFNTLTVSDFIFQKSLVFAGTNLDNDELKLYRVLFDIMLPTLPQPDIVFYLYAPIDELLKNIKKRGRSYEQHIKGEYLESIQQAYLSYFKQMPDLKVVLINTQRFDFVGRANDYSFFKELINTQFTKGITAIE